MTNFDAIIVGSGPAGVSAASPLVEAGLKVLMVDGGEKAAVKPPTMPYLLSRTVDEEQWRWMIGEDFQALRNEQAVSPKLRVPTHSYVFDNFSEANKITSSNFVPVGSLAVGGLSNAWGCGVARLSPLELQTFPFPHTDIQSSYETVTRRMGVSGAVQDDLSTYFGLDEWADPPIQMDGLHSRLFEKYKSKKKMISQFGLKLGRSRVAALSLGRGTREACDLSGNCLWGCDKRALYSATEDLAQLQRKSNFHYRSGFLVTQVLGDRHSASIIGGSVQTAERISAKKVILAAGTLATTRLALEALDLNQPIALQSCPTAAFLLWTPSALGLRREDAFGLGQLSFTLRLNDEHTGFGSLFSTAGIPVTEFAKRLPFRKRNGIAICRGILSSCVIGNIFLDGALASTTLRLDPRGGLQISGGYHSTANAMMMLSKTRLIKAFRKMGAVLVPSSFTLGEPGSDIHYACSLPMRVHPTAGETDRFGEVCGLRNVHVVDGACLSRLTEKSHTLTIMANADRIGNDLVGRVKSID